MKCDLNGKENKTDKRAIVFPARIYNGRSGSRTNYSDGGIMTEPVSNRRAEHMINMYQGKPRQKIDSVGFVEGIKQLAYLAAMPLVMYGAPIRAAQMGRALYGSRLYKGYGFIKRPVLTTAVNAEIKGAKAAMAVSKTYGRTMLALSAYELDRNIKLAKQREWKRLGISLYGPPGSLWVYDNYLADNSSTDKMISEAKIVKSRRGGSLPSKPKTRGKDSYRPAERKIDAFINGHIPNYNPCKKGYRFDLKKKLCIKV